MSSDNLTGADNQQETGTFQLELDPLWVVGFVDGEGCFCVSVHHNPRNARRTGGWQLHPVFQVTQHQRHRAVLEELRTFFACGRVRPKGPRSSVLAYAVDSLESLEGSILPFFEQYPPAVKQADFRLFAVIVRSMRRKEHLHASRFERVLRLAYAMNADGKQRARSLEQILPGSSETARQASHVT
jgi:hypothetical protein